MKDIPGFNDYMVDTEGNVWSKRRKIFLKNRIGTGGYVEYSLFVNRVRRTMRGHRLVAMTWIPNPENKPEVDHIDRNRSNNNLCNLRWATHSENQNNRSIPVNNKTGIMNISYRKDGRWIYTKVFQGKRTYKGFFTKEEAIKYKEENQMNIMNPPGYCSSPLPQ